MKKTTAFLLSLAMIFGAVLPVSAEEEKAAGGGESVSPLIEKFSRLGIVSPLVNTANGFITRAELVSAALKLQDCENLSAAETVFIDVDKDSKYSGNIFTAYQLGLISAPESRLFRPDETIKFNEMYTVLVSALGYREKAEYYGGYPSGYLRVAESLGILRKNAGGVSPTMYEALWVIDKCLGAGIAVASTVYSDRAEYVAQSNVTVLSEYHDIWQDDGILQAMGHFSLYGGKDLGPGEALIDGVRFLGDPDYLADYVGCKIRYYYRKEGNDSTVLYAESKSANRELVINADDIVKFSGGRYYYENPSTGRETSVKVAADPLILYNGRIASGSVKDLYTPGAGSVRLTDSDGDGLYDVLVIKSYVNYVVQSVDVSNRTIYDKYSGQHISFDESGGVDAKLLTASGKEIFITTVIEWSVVSALKSADGSYLRGVVYNDQVAGAVEEIGRGGDSDSIVVNGAELEIAKSLRATGELDKLSPGAPVVCCLDFEGKVAGIQFIGKSDYAYCLLLAYENEGGLKNSAKVRLLDAAGDVRTYILPEKIRIDGKSLKTPDDQVTALKKGLAIGRAARIRLSADGELSDIDTLNTADGEIADQSIRVYFEKTAEQLYKSSGNVEDSFFITKDTMVIFEYSSISDLNERYNVSDMSKLQNDTRYTVSAYSVGETFTPQMVIVENAVSGATVTDLNVWIVEKISKGLDGKREEYNALTLNNGSESKKLYLEDEELAGLSLEQGDMIRADFIRDNYLLNNDISKVYDISGDRVLEGYKNGDAVLSTNAGFATRLGYVYDKIGSYFSLAVTDDRSSISPNGVTVASIPANFILMKVKKSGAVTIEKAAQNALKGYKTFGENCARVLIRYRYRVPYQLIVIEKE